MAETRFKLDCRHFNGYMPCTEHKKHKTTCDQCSVYSPAALRILIIKTGAAGDVVRTTPLLRKLRQDYPQAFIAWLTLFPDLVPSAAVDQKLLFTWENVISLEAQTFDLVINLDKSAPEAALLKKLSAKKKMGFTLSDQGKVMPIDDSARPKWETGVDDVLMKKNKKHFVEETFEICGYEFNGEKYWMDSFPDWEGGLPIHRPLVGLNTGCGERWLTRLWPEQNFVDTAKELMKNKFGVVLLGGPSEHEKNLRIAKETGAFYPGLQSIPRFISLIQACDIVVTSVTMALHLSIAQGKRIVLFNNIFPSNEFHLYGLGEILEPGLKCQSCYKNKFDESCQAPNCMSLISVDSVVAEVEKQLKSNLRYKRN